MIYNPIPDLIIFAALLTMLALLVKVTTKKPRGATPERDRTAIELHQKIRRFENDL